MPINRHGSLRIGVYIFYITILIHPSLLNLFQLLLTHLFQFSNILNLISDLLLKKYHLNLRILDFILKSTSLVFFLPTNLLLYGHTKEEIKTRFASILASFMLLCSSFMRCNFLRFSCFASHDIFTWYGLLFANCLKLQSEHTKKQVRGFSFLSPHFSCWSDAYRNFSLRFLYRSIFLLFRYLWSWRNFLFVRTHRHQ